MRFAQLGQQRCLGSSVVNDRILRVCMAYSQCASFLVQSFLVAVLFEFDEGAEASRASFYLTL